MLAELLGVPGGMGLDEAPGSSVGSHPEEARAPDGAPDPPPHGEGVANLLASADLRDPLPADRGRERGRLLGDAPWSLPLAAMEAEDARWPRLAPLPLLAGLREREPLMDGVL